MVEWRVPVITGENWRGAAWNGNSTIIILLGKRGEQRVEKENGRHVGRERERGGGRGGSATRGRE